MIKKILKDVLEKILLRIMKSMLKSILLLLFLCFGFRNYVIFLPEKINILHNGDTYYPIPSILGIWLVPVISLVLNFTFIKQKSYHH